MKMSQITCTKWHNTNKMAEFTNDFNKYSEILMTGLELMFIIKFGKKKNIFTILD
jgi:hypothetical protein